MGLTMAPRRETCGARRDASAGAQARLKAALQEAEKYKAALALQATAVAGSGSSTDSGIAQDFDISSHRLALPDQN